MANKRPVELCGYSTQAVPGWKARLVTNTDGDRPVNIAIDNPYELAHVRRQLNKIEAYWNAALQRGNESGRGQ